MKDRIPEKRQVIKRATLKEAVKLLLPFVGIFLTYAIHMILPNVYPAVYKPMYWGPFLLICAGLYAFLYAASLIIVPLRNRMLRFSWLLCFVFLFVEIYDIATLKTGWLKLPFMPSPDNILEQFVVNFSSILQASSSSLERLALGFSIGLFLGLVSGLLSGCSRIANYWISPLLKIIGPVPGLVWLPVCVIALPSSRAGSIAVIVLAVWFPITLMLANALKNTDIDLVERAETLGASKARIVLRVMLPAAIPALADGLFMALSLGFAALFASEMAGAQTGLALSVRQMGSVANFGVVFAYVLMMIIIFSSLMMIMFAVRNWLLRWQKGLVRW